VIRVALHSPPRSGSTWLGSIFDSHPSVVYRYQPLFSYAFKGRLGPNSSFSEIRDFFLQIADTDDKFVNRVEAKKKGLVPDFDKSEGKAIIYKEVRYHHILKNLLATDPEVKVIGLIRNPISTIYSWLNAPKEFKSSWDPLEEWRYAPRKNQGRPEEFNGYEKWKEVAFLFLDLKKSYQERFFLVTYEALNENPKEVASKLFAFIGLPWAEQTGPFLKESTSRPSSEPYGVFREKRSSYRHTKDIHPTIREFILSDPEFENLVERYPWDRDRLY
jgi:hypothetical protein